MKTYVLTVSKTFPVTHQRKGKPTFFVHKILKGQKKILPCDLCDEKHICKNHCKIESINFKPKIHTIRSNFELWSKRIEQIQKGEAILSLRYWSGKPYNSKQIEICQLDKDSGVGIQGIAFDMGDWSIAHVYTKGKIDTNFLFPSYVKLSENDGLSVEDFKEWFKNYDLSKMMAIIHFTEMRY